MGKHYQEAKNSFKPIPKYIPKYEKKKAAAESFKPIPKYNPKYEKKKAAAESFKKASLNLEIPQLVNTEAIRFNPQSTTFFKPGEVKHKLITRIPPKQIISNEKENNSLPNNEPTESKKIQEE